jgi:hypothetical protein
VQQWEYVRLRYYRDQSLERPEVLAYVYREGGQPEEKGVQSNRNDLVAELGREGWEMVGPPVREMAAFAAVGHSGGRFRIADWSSEEYWFKRPIAR